MHAAKETMFVYLVYLQLVAKAMYHYWCWADASPETRPSHQKFPSGAKSNNSGFY